MTMSSSDLWTFSNEPNYRLVSVTGDDAESFLQGQLTQDVHHFKEDEAKWTASCNHQGRVASSSLIFRIPNGFGLMMPVSIAETEVQRLSKFILRSKVTIAIESVPITFFATKEKDSEKITVCPAIPAEPMKVYRGKSVTVVRLPSKAADGFSAKFVAFGKLPDMMESGKTEENMLPKALMEEGVALIDKAESLEWLPQFLNLDLIGAISFNKGCYTGQEVVAKTQHLGRVKRRMLLGQANIENVDEGTEVFMINEPMGRVIQCVGNTFLFVIRADYLDSDFTVKGESVKVIDFPYTVTLPESKI
ncbi:CAF17-like 4Fe-4S cluster assembly/insertion protein YgfZ [Turicimonas muris]|uniref:CAF17-like 4Fe-4S cluster assembly/insertion protein YgfZ n=3 Tax=Turicimonas muris TaxID=1796652 RepID=UPI0023EFC5A9|nr:folate-binding protein [Turicimonas muris]